MLHRNDDYYFLLMSIAVCNMFSPLCFVSASSDGNNIDQLATTYSGHVDDKANKLHAIASLRVLLDATKEQAVANGREATNEEVWRKFVFLSNNSVLSCLLCTSHESMTQSILLSFLSRSFEAFAFLDMERTPYDVTNRMQHSWDCSCSIHEHATLGKRGYCLSYIHACKRCSL